MPQVKCPMCASLVTYADGFSPVCSSCGYAGPLPASAAAHMGPAHSGPSQAVAIVALILNIVIWPGLGTMIGGRIGEGLAQGFLFLLGLFLTISFIFFFVGIPLMIAMWIWALVSGIQLINQANQPSTPRPV